MLQYKEERIKIRQDEEEQDRIRQEYKEEQTRITQEYKDEHARIRQKYKEDLTRIKREYKEDQARIRQQYEIVNSDQQKHHYCSNKDSLNSEPDVKREDAVPKSKERNIYGESSNSRRKSPFKRCSTSRTRRRIRQCVGSSGRMKYILPCGTPLRGPGSRRCYGRNRRSRMSLRKDRGTRRSSLRERSKCNRRRRICRHSLCRRRNTGCDEIFRRKLSGEGCMATKDRISLCSCRPPVRRFSPTGGSSHTPVSHLDDRKRGSKVPPSNLSSSGSESQHWDQRMQGAPPDEILECIGMMFDRDDQI